MNTKRLVTVAVLIALYTVLSLFSANLGLIKLTFESFPVLVASLMFGWVDGLLVGAVGGLLNQMLTYGFTVTTLMWILPNAVRGLLVGLVARLHRGLLVEIARDALRPPRRPAQLDDLRTCGLQGRQAILRIVREHLTVSHRELVDEQLRIVADLRLRRDALAGLEVDDSCGSTQHFQPVDAAGDGPGTTGCVRR